MKPALLLSTSLVFDKGGRILARGERALPPTERRTFERTLLRSLAREGARDASRR